MKKSPRDRRAEGAADQRRTPEVRRILVARFGAIGDLLLTTPVLRALARRYPGAQIDYLVGKGLAPVLRGHPKLAEVIEFDKRADARPGAFVAFGRRLRERRYDLFVNLQRSVKTVLLGLASGASRTVVYRRTHAVQRDSGRMQHAVENFLHTLEPIGAPIDAVGRHLDFVVGAAARQHVAAWLAGQGVQARDRLVLVNPGASAASRRWPAAHLAAVLDALVRRRPELRVALIGGPGDDQALAKAVRSAMSSAEAVFDWVAAVDFEQTGALLERASLLVTMDTGPMHLAAAIGTPIVALFGPTEPDRTGPTPPPPRTHRAAPRVLVHRDGLDCVPCHARSCKRGHQGCITGHAPEQLVDAIEQSLAAAPLALPARPARPGAARQRRARTMAVVPR